MCARARLQTHSQTDCGRRQRSTRTVSSFEGDRVSVGPEQPLGPRTHLALLIIQAKPPQGVPPPDFVCRQVHHGARVLVFSDAVFHPAERAEHDTGDDRVRCPVVRHDTHMGAQALQVLQHLVAAAGLLLEHVRLLPHRRHQNCRGIQLRLPRRRNTVADPDQHPHGHRHLHWDSAVDLYGPQCPSRPLARHTRRCGRDRHGARRRCARPAAGKEDARRVWRDQPSLHPRRQGAGDDAEPRVPP
mmetsp:Transcript_45533/g.113051  ORF Transcript_45533/g.113051 Transcript_45533/m.113051 type:complete len:244 (+) Transcript_45533:629-1360(+)